MKAATICVLVSSLGIGCGSDQAKNLTVEESVKILKSAKPEYSFTVDGTVDGFPYRVEKHGDRIDILSYEPTRYKKGDNQTMTPSLMVYIEGPKFGDGDDFFSPLNEEVRSGTDDVDHAEILKYLQAAVSKLR